MCACVHVFCVRVRAHATPVCACARVCARARTPVCACVRSCAREETARTLIPLLAALVPASTPDTTCTPTPTSGQPLYAAVTCLHLLAITWAAAAGTPHHVGSKEGTCAPASLTAAPAPARSPAPPAPRGSLPPLAASVAAAAVAVAVAVAVAAVAVAAVAAVAVAGGA
eukprot:1761777-Rhodomonas_salina.1